MPRKTVIKSSHTVAISTMVFPPHNGLSIPIMWAQKPGVCVMVYETLEWAPKIHTEPKS